MSETNDPRGAPHCACKGKLRCAVHYAADRWGLNEEQAADWLWGPDTGPDDDETPSQGGET